MVGAAAVAAMAGGVVGLVEAITGWVIAAGMVGATAGGGMLGVVGIAAFIAGTCGETA